MQTCAVTLDLIRYDRAFSAGCDEVDWVCDGPVICPTCDECGLFFSTYLRAPATTCGRCQYPTRYPFIPGDRADTYKRAKWTEGPVMADEIEMPSCDDDDGWW